MTCPKKGVLFNFLFIYVVFVDFLTTHRCVVKNATNNNSDTLETLNQILLIGRLCPSVWNQKGTRKTLNVPALAQMLLVTSSGGTNSSEIETLSVEYVYDVLMFKYV